MDIDAAIIAHLAAQPGIASGVATYGGIPAIFKADTVPANAPRPFIAVGLTTSRDTGDYSESGHDSSHDVRVFSEVGAARSANAIEDLAYAIHRALHRKGFPLPGGRLIACRASLPAATPTSGPDVFGRRVTVMISSEEI